MQAIPDRTHKSIYNALRKIVKIYTHFSFCITHILGDGEFENLDPSVIFLGFSLKIVSNDEHEPEIERYIRTIKDHMRSVFTSPPFKKFPNQLLVEIVSAQVFWLNALPANNVISQQRIRQNVITGATID